MKAEMIGSSVETANVKKETKTYKYFDLTSFTEKEETRVIDFTPAETMDEANTRLGGDPEKVLAALNAALRANYLAAIETEVNALGGRKSVVLAVAKPFRAMPPFSAIKERKKQTDAILDLIKSNPAMIEAIRAASQAEPTAEETEESEAENDSE